ncbi:GNAT family N-acetyltransferase [Cohnella zeiphila]|uniref:GNAT family N-acetyltransferase n=1 Tax=Cohnella zeiphila TaxID=2761120 RepID=A0A7X0VXY1_9BACL|nr:GNAT family N-acetyltransferase [Cohnella zeiphila]MBB6732383.1 GNAT family N-acetyltransferase [Cohnella zeiphila]
MKKQMVLLEGIPGSGKSTLARFMAIQMERNGRRPILFHETTADHPIIFLDAVPDTEAWMDTYRSRWSEFLNSDSDPGVLYVMESSLFQFPILSMLNRDVDRQAIRTFVREILELLERHDAQLVFLYSDDSASAIREMIQSRGGDAFLKQKYKQNEDENYYRNRGQTGAKLHLIFLEEYAALARELAERASLPTMAVERSARDWPSYQRRLLERFGLNLIPDPPVEEAKLQRYAGKYRNEEMNLDIAVECREGKLFIFGNRLLKCRSENVFYLDDMSVEVVFREVNGRFERIVIGEKDLYANRREEGTPFKRIAYRKEAVMFEHRPLEETDLETISSFPQTAEELFYIGPRFEFPLTPEQIRGMLEGRTNPTVVVDSLQGNRPVAYANLYDHNPEDSSCWLGNVIVSDEYRGRGAAEHLIGAMEDAARNGHGLRRLKLYCHNPNTRALIFYCKIGFRPCGAKTIVNREGQKIVAVEMVKEL